MLLLPKYKSMYCIIMFHVNRLNHSLECIKIITEILEHHFNIVPKNVILTDNSNNCKIKVFANKNSILLNNL